MHQAAILRPITERLLRSAGIGRGMRVLDLGCGAGDVSMLAAELVGASGSVVGIDRSPEAIAVARRRARTAELRHVHFEEATVGAFSGIQPFDMVIGRYVLIHQDRSRRIHSCGRGSRPIRRGFGLPRALCTRTGCSIASHRLALAAGRGMDPDGVPGRGTASRCGRSADRALFPRRPAATDRVLRVPRRSRRGFASRCLDRGDSRELSAATRQDADLDRGHDRHRDA